jgi:hypothetical protein
VSVKDHLCIKWQPTKDKYGDDTQNNEKPQKWNKLVKHQMLMTVFLFMMVMNNQNRSLKHVFNETQSTRDNSTS